jgi:tetratricopeptide (TPR) repeat protein
MEFVEGETLAQILARLRAAEGKEEEERQTILQSLSGLFGKDDCAAPDTEIEPEVPTLARKTLLESGDFDLEYCARLARAFAGVAEGLQHSHSKGIIHRDIKPSNLILDKEGRLRILDFGIAHLAGQESLTLSGDFVGTLLYMSPEQASRRKIPIDHRTDIYSLGATLYEMLTHRPPFQGKDHSDTLSQIIEREPVEPRKLNPRVPKDLETIVLKCLRKEPADRYGTAEALAQDLRRFVRGDPVEARPPTAWELLARRVFRHRRKLFVAAGIAAFLLVCGALAWRLRLEQETSKLYLAQSYEKQVVAAAMKLLRAERVLVTRSGGSPESTNILSQRYQDLLSGNGKLVAEEAVLELTRAITDLPDRFEAYHYRAKGLKLLERNAAAIEDLGQCLRRNPGFLPAKALLADLGDTDAEREKPLPSPAPDGNDRWGGAWLRAHQAMQREAWEEAAAAYGEILTLEEESKGELFLGSSIENLIGRGVARMESKDFEGAKLDFWAARTLSRKLWGDFLEPLLLLGKAYVLEGKPSRAEEIFREALDRSSDMEQMSLWIAAAYQSLLGDLEQSGRTGEAVAAARKAVQLHAEDRDALLRLGWALLRDDWWKKEQEAKGAPEAGPDALHAHAGRPPDPGATRRLRPTRSGASPPAGSAAPTFRRCRSSGCSTPGRRCRYSFRKWG